MRFFRRYLPTSSTYTVFKYHLIDEEKPTTQKLSMDNLVSNETGVKVVTDVDNNNWMRLSPEIFKKHIFELFKYGFVPSPLSSVDYKSNDGKNYYSILFSGNYYANLPAIKFLLGLKIPVYISFINHETESNKNDSINGLTLFNKSDVKIFTRGQFGALETEAIAGRDYYPVDTLNKDIELLKDNDFNSILSNFSCNSYYFNFNGESNECLRELTKNFDYVYAFSGNDMVSAYTVGGIKDKLSIPTINATLCNTVEAFDKLLTVISSRKVMI